MLKIRNETKIGLLAVTAILLAIWGFQYLKGRNLLTSSKTFYVRYQNVDQLKPSAPIYINGFQVGMIKDLYVDPKDDRTIIAVLNVDRGIDVPKNAKATIVGLGLMGGRAIQLDFTGPCSGDDCAESGSWLEGEMKSLLETVIGDPSQLDEYMLRLRVGLTSIYDSIADPRDPQGFGHTLVALQHSLQNLAIMTAKINHFLDASTAGFTATANNTAEITKAIRESNQEIATVLNNLAEISEQLKEARLDISAQKATTAIDSVAVSVSALRSTLQHTEQTIQRVDTLAQKLVAGEGTAGKILTDEALYDNLVTTTRHLQLLLQDLRLNPKRYNTVKLKVFGKNKTGDYENPMNDPAYQMLVDSLEQDYQQRLKQ